MDIKILGIVSCATFILGGCSSLTPNQLEKEAWDSLKAQNPPVFNGRTCSNIAILESEYLVELASEKQLIAIAELNLATEKKSAEPAISSESLALQNQVVTKRNVDTLVIKLKKSVQKMEELELKLGAQGVESTETARTEAINALDKAKIEHSEIETALEKAKVRNDEESKASTREKGKANEARRKIEEAEKRVRVAEVEYSNVKARSEAAIITAENSTGEYRDADLCKAYAFSDHYRQRYIELSGDAYNWNTGFDALGLLAGLTGIYGIGFDESSDLIKGSALALGAIMGAKSYAQPLGRSELYLQGAQRMQCVIDTSPAIINSSLSASTMRKYRYDMLEALASLESFTSTELDSLKAYIASDAVKVTPAAQEALKLLEVYNNIKLQSGNIRDEANRTYALVLGMPDEIVVATKKAELKLSQEFVKTAPSFEESLTIIKGALSEGYLTQSQKVNLDATFASFSPTDEKELAGFTTDPGKAELLKLTTLVSKVKITRESYSSIVINYQDVRTALKLCNAV
ncbi:hypothetical protein [Vibrio atlanticus]|uniref:Uncharacterized protein n=1 Tax=Vibrio atlanticus (strain LGP32) TaxID=575788 RepID=B7VS81_VIBA3|nr:hypothetical protein [Vibrio atlanticus]CAV26997.1 Hypothetical protein VS_II1101 [Vibrio atlanticus]